MTLTDRFIKRTIDIGGALFGLALLWPIILGSSMVARFDTGKSGFFWQKRIGLNGKPFYLIKIRTMRDIPGHHSTVTTNHDPRITPIGRWLRKSKFDELPQLFNILIGDMSFVGPRPDVEQFTGHLVGEDAVILSIRPGITGPASIKYRFEEELLSTVANPEDYNRDVIFPDKIRINKQYISEYRIRNDIIYLLQTLSWTNGSCQPTGKGDKSPPDETPSLSNGPIKSEVDSPPTSARRIA